MPETFPTNLRLNIALMNRGGKNWSVMLKFENLMTPC